MKKSIYILPLIFCILSCKKDSTHTTTGSVHSSVFGMVTDESGNPVANALVSSGTTTASTNSLGVFVMKDLSLSKENAVIHIMKAGYFDGIRTILRPSESVNQVNVTLLTKRLLTSFNAADTGTIPAMNTKIVIPANGIKNTDGTLYSGIVNVYGSYLDPNDAKLLDKIPGDLAGLNASGEETLLKTFGMVNIVLEGSSGQPLNIADDKNASIYMFVPANLVGIAPATIQLGHLDESTGVWMEDGTGTLNGNVYVGEVSHFSWWTFFIPSNAIVFTLTLHNSSGTAIGNAKLKITDMTGSNGVRYGYSDNNGIVTGMVPQNSVLKVEILTPCGTYAPVNNFGPYSTSTSEIATVSDATFYDIYKGKLMDCSGSALSDVIYMSSPNYNTVIMSDANGLFNFNVKRCTLNDTMFALRFGPDETTVYRFHYGAGTNNLGNLSLDCSNETNFIEYSLNGGTLTRFVSNTVDYYNIAHYNPDYVYHILGSGNLQTVVGKRNTNSQYIMISNNNNSGTYDAAIVTNATDTLFLKRQSSLPDMYFEENTSTRLIFAEDDYDGTYKEFNSADTTTYRLSYRYRVTTKY